MKANIALIQDAVPMYANIVTTIGEWTGAFVVGFAMDILPANHLTNRLTQTITTRV
jgi:hypothetical protein